MHSDFPPGFFVRPRMLPAVRPLLLAFACLLLTAHLRAAPPGEVRFNRARILGEWQKLEPYKAKGFIADWPGDQHRSSC